MEQKLTVACEKKGGKLKWIILCAVLAALLLGGILYLILRGGSSGAFSAIPQTEDESRVVMQNGSLSVTYDLYRYFFLNFDGLYAEKPVTEEEKAARFAAVDAEARTAIARLYATLDMETTFGNTSDTENIASYYDTLLDMTHDGGEFDGVTYFGYDTVDEYLTDISSHYMNDTVYRLYLKKIATEYCVSGTYLLEEPQKNPFTEEDVYAFFMSDDAIRVTYAYIAYDSYLMDTVAARETADLVYQSLIARKGNLQSYIHYELQASTAVIGTSEQSTIENGLYLTRYYSDNYSLLNEVAFRLSFDDTDNNSDMALYEAGDGIYILRLLPKNETELRNSADYEALYASYLSNRFNKQIADAAEMLLASLTATEFLNGLTYDSVK